MLSKFLKCINELTYLKLPLIISYGIAIQGLFKCFLTCLYLQTIWGVNVLGFFFGGRRMELSPLFYWFDKYLLSASLYPSHTEVLAKTDKVPTHLVELTYFCGCGWVADSWGWEMCHEQPSNKMNKIILGSNKPEEETSADNI